MKNGVILIALGASGVCFRQDTIETVRSLGVLKVDTHHGVSGRDKRFLFLFCSATEKKKMMQPGKSEYHSYASVIHL